jgi:hypothetical protein
MRVELNPKQRVNTRVRFGPKRANSTYRTSSTFTKFCLRTLSFFLNAPLEILDANLALH